MNKNDTLDAILLALAFSFVLMFITGCRAFAARPDSRINLGSSTVVVDAGLRDTLGRHISQYRCPKGAVLHGRSMGAKIAYQCVRWGQL